MKTITSLSAIFGILYVFVESMGGSIMLFVHIVEIAAFILIPPTLTITTFGTRRFFRSCKCLILPQEDSQQAIEPLRRYLSANYATGTLLFLIQLMLALTANDEPNVFRAMIFSSIVPLLYAVIVSEFFIRTAIAKATKGFEQSISVNEDKPHN